MKKPNRSILVGFAVIACTGLTACAPKVQMQMTLPALNAQIKDNPHDMHALTMRAYYYEQLGDTKNALADWRAISVSKPNGHDDYVYRSVAFLKLKDYPHALDDADAAIKIKPDASDWANRGTIHVFMKQMNLATQDYFNALKLDNNSAGANEGLGEIAFKTKNYDQGITYCTRALSADPRLLDALYFRGQCLQALGKKDEASRDLNAAKVGGYVPDELFIHFVAKKR